MTQAEKEKIAHEYMKEKGYPSDCIKGFRIDISTMIVDINLRNRRNDGK